MNARVDQLLEEALRLPVDERSAIVTALVDSLDGAESASLAQVWREELRRRRDALRAGQTTAASWTDARVRMTAR